MPLPLMGQRIQNSPLNIGFKHERTGDYMDFTIVIYGIYLALGLIIFCLPLYFWRRSEKIRLAAIDRELRAKVEAGINPFDDGFYCIMRKDGRCASGYIDRPPAE